MIVTRIGSKPLFFAGLWAVVMNAGANVMVREDAYEDCLTGVKWRAFPKETASVAWTNIASLSDSPMPVFTSAGMGVFGQVTPFLRPQMKPVKGPGELVVRLVDLDGRPLTGSFELRVQDAASDSARSYAQYCKLASEMRFAVTNDTYRFDGMFIRPADTNGVRRIILRELSALHAATGASAVELDVATGNDLHLARDGEERPSLTLRNRADRALTLKGLARATDYFDHIVAFPVAATVEPGQVARVPVPWPLPGKGVWKVRCQLNESDGSQAVHDTRFAWIDRHEVTPIAEKPVFRMGVHASYPPFSDAVRNRVVAAFVACGAKIIRTAAATFEQVYPYSFDKPYWTAHDKWIDLLRANGLAINSSIYTPPRWARAPERMNEPDGNRTRYIPPAPGNFQRYCREIAARYGTKIDYYEVGNEWDLIPKNVFGMDEALRLQREAWDGLKAGNPKACVCANGWACAVSDEFPKGRAPQPGFIEEFMRKAKGLYDVHAVHLHGTFPNYVPRVANMKRLRKDLSIEDVPWFSNETALSCHGDIESEVAATVWKKIIYAWAHGSIDYIWYNMHATGWVVGDSEQEYGLMTADWHPRDGYAAFSALTALANGLSAEGIVFEQGNSQNGAARFAFRVSGTRGNMPRQVIFAWDGLPGTPEPIVVKTDAVVGFVVDLMGNRTRILRKDGAFTWTPGPTPAALLLVGANTAEVEAATNRSCNPKVATGPVSLTCETIADITEYYAADPDPEARARLWKGKIDLSGKFRFVRKDDKIAVGAVVTDDKDASPRAGFGTEDGDSLVVEVRNADNRLKRIPLAQFDRVGMTTRYRGDVTVGKAAVEIRVLVYDNDGQGANGFLHTPWQTL